VDVDIDAKLEFDIAIPLVRNILKYQILIGLAIRAWNSN
jgi:hypothetical protein